MQDEAANQEQLLSELHGLQRRVAELEEGLLALKQAEVLLKESEERYRSLLQNAPAMIYRMSLPDGTYEYVSDASAAITGVSPEEFLKAPLLVRDHIHPEFAEYFAEQWSRLLSGDIPAFYEYKFIRKSGESRWLHQTNTLIRDQEGKPVAIEGIVTDITERKHAEEALRESEERHKTILHAAMDGFALLDMQGRLLQVNEAFCRMSGYSEQELLSMNISDFEALESPIDTVAHLRRVIMQGQDRFETQHRRKDGGVLELEVSAQYLPMEKGPFACFLHDITERKEMANELWLSEEKYRSMVEATSDCIWEIDPQERYTYLSPKFEDLTGYPPEEFLGRTPYDLLPEDQVHKVREQVLSRIAAQQPVSSVEAQVRHRDGRPATVEVSSVPIFSPEGEYQGRRGVTRDITERKRAEEALRKSEERFRVAQESSLDAFTILDAVRNENGRIVDFQWTCANPEAGRILRHPPEELVGKRLLELSLGVSGRCEF